jgi:hypothetical protein
MADFNQETLDWMEANKDLLSGTSLDTNSNTEEPEEEAVEEPMDPELEAFLKRNPDIDITGTSLDPNNRLSPIPGTGQIAVDVTEETQEAARQYDSLTYEGLYGERPDYPATSTLINTFDPEDEGSAQEVSDYEEAFAEWSDNATEVYNNTGFTLPENNKRYYNKVVRTGTDENGDPIFESKYFMIPSPTGVDSFSAIRALEQGARDIVQSLGGLVSTGNPLKESPFERYVADYAQEGGEALGTTLIGLGIPLVGVTGKAKKYAGSLTKAGRLSKKGELTTDVLTSTLVETIMAQEGDQGLLIKPERFEGVFGEEGAKSVSLFVDGMLLNGLLDGTLALVGSGLRVLGDKTSATRKLTNKDILRDAVKNDTMGKVLTYLDPKLTSVSAAEAKRRIFILSEKMEAGGIIELALGDFKREVKTDTPTAMLRVSEAFVREADQNLLSTMTEAQFEDHVANEAARMSTAMINIMRSQQSSPIVQNAANTTSNEIGLFMKDAAEDALPSGASTVDEAGQQTAENIVGTVDDEMATLTNQATDVAAQTDDLLSRQRTVVQDNEIVLDIIGDTNVFGADLSTVQQAVTDLFSDDVYTAYRQAFDEVDAAYKSLPDAQIDAGMLRDQLKAVVRDANSMDQTGTQTASILRDILEPFNPQATKIDDPLPVVGEDGMIKIGEENLDQILDRVTADISFQALYEIKGNMSSIIDRYKDNPRVQQRLIAFRNHITDAENGQIASIAKSNPDVAAEYLKADALFKEAKSKFSSSDEVRALERKLAERRKFDPERTGNEYPGPFDRNEQDTIIGGRRLADQSLADVTGTLDTQIKYMLDGIRSPEDVDGAFRDLFVAQAAQDLRKRILESSGTDQTEQIVAQAFLPYQQKLTDVGATDVLAQVRTAFDDIVKTRSELGDDILANKALLDKLDKQVYDAQQGVVAELISDVSGRQQGITGPAKLVTRSDAATRLEAILTGPDSVNRVNELKGKIARLPEAQRVEAEQALQSIALNAIGTRIFGATPVGIKSRTVALGAVAKLTDNEASNLLKSIDTVFSATDDQVLMKEMVLDTLDTLYQSTLPQRLKVSQAGSDTAINTRRDQDIQDAASTAILLFAGYMNPTAAMLRRMSAVPIQQAEQLQKEVAANTLAVIATDPVTFAKYAKAYANGSSPSVLEDIVRGGINSTYRTGREESRIQEEGDPRPFDKDMLQLFGIVE